MSAYKKPAILAILIFFKLAIICGKGRLLMEIKIRTFIENTMGSPEIVTSIKTIGSSCAWSLLKGNQIKLKERCRQTHASCGTMH